MSEAKWAAFREELRDKTIGCVIDHLGEESERDARWLAERMIAHFENIAASAGGMLTLKAPLPDGVSEEVSAYVGELIETATDALLNLLQQVLTVAERHGDRA